MKKRVNKFTKKKGTSLFFFLMPCQCFGHSLDFGLSALVEYATKLYTEACQFSCVLLKCFVIEPIHEKVGQYYSTCLACGPITSLEGYGWDQLRVYWILELIIKSIRLKKSPPHAFKTSMFNTRWRLLRMKMAVVQCKQSWLF